MEVVASHSQGRTAAAQCGLFTYKSVPVIFEPPFHLMVRYHCRIVLEELSMSMKIFSQCRLPSGKDSNLASVLYKPDPLPHSHFPNIGTICNSID